MYQNYAHPNMVESNTIKEQTVSRTYAALGAAYVKMAEIYADLPSWQYQQEPLLRSQQWVIDSLIQQLSFEKALLSDPCRIVDQWDQGPWSHYAIIEDDCVWITTSRRGDDEDMTIKVPIVYQDGYYHWQGDSHSDSRLVLGSIREMVKKDLPYHPDCLQDGTHILVNGDGCCVIIPPPIPPRSRPKGERGGNRTAKQVK